MKPFKFILAILFICIALSSCILRKRGSRRYYVPPSIGMARPELPALG